MWTARRPRSTSPAPRPVPWCRGRRWPAPAPGPTLAVSGTVADASPVIVDVNGVLAAVAGGAFNATVPSPDGPLPLVATARDAALNSATDARTVTVDSGPPVIQVTAPPDGFVTS